MAALKIVYRALLAGAFFSVFVVPSLAQDAVPGTAPELVPEQLSDSTQAVIDLKALEKTLVEAEEALLEADVEGAERAARKVSEALAAGAGDDEKRRALAARAFDLMAQARYTLGDKSGASEAIDRLIALQPGYQASGEIVGPKYVALFSARRSKLVGYLRVHCSPLPCEKVLVDGRERVFKPESELAVAAGEHVLVLIRHGFSDLRMDGVKVAAGDTVELTGEMEQVARDVVISTRPAGAELRFDGKLLGHSEAAEDGDLSRPFLVREVPPGPHEIVIEAPCFRRVAIALDVVLDALDSSPMSFGTIELEASRARLVIDWKRPEGIILVDGVPTPTGRHELCPGVHELALSLGGRRAWFEKVELAHEEVRKIVPLPRPTLAISGLEGMTSDAPLVGEGWNRLSVDSDQVEGALGTLLARLLGGAGGAPLYPDHLTGVGDELRTAAQALAPEADLLAIWRPGTHGVRAAKTLVLIDAKRGLFEASSWLADDPRAAEQLRASLEVKQLADQPFLGLDLVARRGGAPVIAGMHPASPAQEVSVGMELRSFAGTSVSSVAEFNQRLAALDPGQEVELVLADAKAERTIRVTPLRNLRVAVAEADAKDFALPALARAEADRKTGRALVKLAASIRAGMILARLGRTREAATLLDGAEIGDEVDPSQDARGTVSLVLERLMRQLDDGEGYASEIAARRQALREARFGGRAGPPLRYAE